jgi:flavin reductase (DIM6/NTAB) family NADH-FMN oxidoreductase RutF
MNMLDMTEWRTVSPYDFDENIFHMIDREWMLVTAKHPQNDGVNTMTASWGGCGILWNKPVAFVFIRPQRHTYTFTETASLLTLSFFGEEYRDVLRFCGTASGRDCDKFAQTGLHAEEIDGTAVPREARVIFVCRKLYADRLQENAFVDTQMLSHYKNGDYHKMYICEIEKILVRDGASQD